MAAVGACHEAIGGPPRTIAAATLAVALGSLLTPVTRCSSSFSCSALRHKQIGLKNYDPQKDKRFAGNIKLPHIPRPKMRVCVLGDAFHCEKAAAMGLEFKNAEGLKNFNKNKKMIKKFSRTICEATEESFSKLSMILCLMPAP